MKELEYCFDLRTIKLRALNSPKHDVVVKKIADDLGIGIQSVRRCLMDKFDMILIEAVAARYESWIENANEHGTRKKMKSALYTEFIPLIESSDMDLVVSQVEQMIKDGTPESEAVSAGKNQMIKIMGC